MFTDFLDEWWRSMWEGGGSSGGGGGTVGIYAWNLGMSQYGYIGQYLGAYATVRSDMVDLQHPLSGYGADMERRSWERVEINGRSYYARTDENGVYDFTNLVQIGPAPLQSGSRGSRAGTLRDPNLIADNSPETYRYDGRLMQPEKSASPDRRVLELPSAQDWPSAVPGAGRKPTQEDNAPHGGSSYRPADDWMPPSQGRPVYGTDSSSPSQSETTGAAGPSTPTATWNGADTPPSSPPTTTPPPPSTSNVINLPEVTVYGTIPFQPNVSAPGAYERANSVGRIEWNDLVGFARGAWNGLFSASQTLERFTYETAQGPIIGPLVKPLVEPWIRRSDALRLSIGENQEAGALIGEHISENLVFEALPFVPQIARATGRALARLGGVLSDAAIGSAFMFMGVGGIGSHGGRYARLLRTQRAGPVYEFVGWTPIMSDASWARYQAGVGSPWEAVFKVTEGGKTRHIIVDHLALKSSKELSSLVEAKFGDMGQMWIPEREAHILRQAHDYLTLRAALGFKNVRYMVSTSLGAERLKMVFAREFPLAVRDKLLIVEFKPMRW